MMLDLGWTVCADINIDDCLSYTFSLCTFWNGNNLLSKPVLQHIYDNYMGMYSQKGRFLQYGFRCESIFFLNISAKMFNLINKCCFKKSSLTYIFIFNQFKPTYLSPNSFSIFFFKGAPETLTPSIEHTGQASRRFWSLLILNCQCHIHHTAISIPSGRIPYYDIYEPLILTQANVNKSHRRTSVWRSCAIHKM